MPTVTFPCPVCRAQIDTDAANAGTNIKCPTCKKLAPVPELEEEAPPSAPLAVGPLVEAGVAVGWILLIGIVFMLPGQAGAIGIAILALIGFPVGLLLVRRGVASAFAGHADGALAACCSFLCVGVCLAILATGLVGLKVTMAIGDAQQQMQERMGKFKF